jgi:hypothetical protein
LKDPFEFEVADIPGLNLAKQTVALARVAPGVGQPILRFVRGIEEALGCNLSMRSDRNENEQSQRRAQRSYH